MFYGLGKGVFNKANNSHINPYSEQIYYYIKIGSSEGKRISELELSDEAPGLVVDNYVDYKFHEIDEYNIAKREDVGLVIVLILKTKKHSILIFQT